jgi:COP9 signalosome complex subunit 2
MSDDEYEYDEDMEDQDGGGNDDDDDDDDDEQFEYTDEEEEQDDDKVRLENAYYNAKSLRDNNGSQSAMREAVEAFESVISQSTGEEAVADDNNEADRAIWTFKALKQLCKLQLKAGNADEFLRHYKRLLACIKHVSPNAVEKGVGGMMERLTSLCQQQQQQQPPSSGSSSLTISDPQELALQAYNSTLLVFHPVTGSFPNERLWFKTNLKYGQLLYEKNETAMLQAVLKDLQIHHQRSASGDASMGGGGGAAGSPQQSLEIYALQIQLYSRQKDYKRLRETYQTAMSVVAGSLPHPRTLALIQELGGKMYMAGKEYGSAEKSFFQAFKSYDEAGDVSRLRCLKYLVLASMLHASVINPFDSQEARPYRDDAEIVAMTNLVQAFHANDIATFERILKTKATILRDEFIREHMEDLLRTIRRQVLRRVLQPYRRITLQAISTQFLNDIDVKDVESLLVGMILDDVLPAKIDKVDGVLYNYQHKSKGKGGTGGPAGAGASGSVHGGGGGGGAHQHSKGVSPVVEKIRAMESFMDFLSSVNNDATTTNMKDMVSSSSGARGREGGKGSMLRGPGAMMAMH